MDVAFSPFQEVMMLVLARKTSESIWMGDDVRITVVQIQGGRVRLGIEAPPHVRIRREEVLPEPFFERFAPPDWEVAVGTDADDSW
ncbi:MAG: carbon storage regulator [Planctomycetales bacterium]